MSIFTQTIELQLKPQYSSNSLALPLMLTLWQCSRNGCREKRKPNCSIDVKSFAVVFQHSRCSTRSSPWSWLFSEASFICSTRHRYLTWCLIDCIYGVNLIKVCTWNVSKFGHNARLESFVNLSIARLWQVLFEAVFSSRPLKPLFALDDGTGVNEWRFRWTIDRYVSYT